MIKIGCCTWLEHKGKILTLDCSKGRGIVIPGGRYEHGVDASFMEAAKRELEEETGVVASKMKFVFSGLAPDGWYDYCFQALEYDLSNIKKETNEGKVLWSASPDSHVFNPYYEMVKLCLI